MNDSPRQRVPPPTRAFSAGDTARNWDATRAEASIELLQAGFQLAYFIFPDRQTAIDILVQALEKIPTRSRLETRKLYWRDKHADRPVRRIAWTDMDILQWLILYESEQHEKAQERATDLSTEDIIIRYVKHLVRSVTTLSSFYVNVGITRLLHSYTTSQAQSAYEFLTSRYLGPDEYRRAKSVIMDKLIQRFPTLLSVTRTDHGELRFATVDDPREWSALIDDCLRAFSPWSTQHSCTRRIGSNIGSSSTSGLGERTQNDNEVQSCHILIDPECYSLLIRNLGFEPPQSKLAVPRFSMREKQKRNDDFPTAPARPAELAKEDIDDIRRRLKLADARTHNFDSRFVAIVVDGTEHARLDLTKPTDLHIVLDAGVSLIEIRTADDKENVTLGTHFISYNEHRFERAIATTTLGAGKLRLEITPIATTGPNAGQALVAFRYVPKLSFWGTWSLWRNFAMARNKVAGFLTVGAVMLLIGWGIATLSYLKKVRVLQKALETGHQEHPLSPTAAGAIVSYVLTADDQRVRAVGEEGIPEISLRLHSPAITLDLSLPKAAEASNFSAELKTFAGDHVLMTQNFVGPTSAEGRKVVEIVVPAVLLRADNYYTVELHSAARSDRFSFKVISGK